MQSRINFLLLTFLLLQLFPKAALSTNRDVWVYIHRMGASDTEDAMLNLAIYSRDERFSSSRFLSRDNEWYHYSYPADRPLAHFAPPPTENDRFELEFDGKVVQDYLPEGSGTVFIAIRSMDLFPLGAEIWTEKQVMASLSKSNVEIEGKFTIPLDEVIKLPESIGLYHPFRSNSKSTGEVISTFPEVRAYSNNDLLDKTSIEPESDWQSASFNFKFALANPSLVFLRIKNKYYPVVARPHHHYELPFIQKKWTKFEIGPHPSIEWDYYYEMGTDGDYRDEDIAQRFFNQRYPKGLSSLEYNKLVMTLKNLRPGKTDTLMTWAHAIVQTYEGANKEPDQLLDMINKLGRESLQEVFENAYRDKLEHEEYLLLVKQEDRNGGLGFFILSSLVLFVLAFAAKIMNPKSVIGKHFTKFEALFHISVWTMITYGFSVEIRYAIWMVNNPLNMFFLWAVGALFYVNALYLVPKLMIRRKIKLYLWTILGMGVAFGFTFFLFDLNPFKNFFWIHLDGQWHGHLNRHNHYMDGLPPVFCMSLVLAPIYGLLRNYLLNRVPQLEQQKSHLKSELKALKTQISPHFFFNSLNTVYSYALGEDSPKTAEAITKLSDMMRFVIYHGDKTQVALSKELEYLEDYIELQKLRLNQVRHDVRFRITGEAGDLSIAPLILITPIENAFKHGISMSNDSFIYIDLLIQDTGIILTVENSVHEGQLIPVSGKTLAEEESGVGIQNTRQRLDLLYTGNYEWYAEEGIDRYYTQLCIDLM